MEDNNICVYFHINNETKEVFYVSVEQLDLSSNVLNVFDAVRYAEFSTGIDRSSIIRVCKGKVNTAGGFKWRYSNASKIQLSND